MTRYFSERPLEGYEVKDRSNAFLGEGTYGTVYLATEKTTGRQVAIKQHHDIAEEEGVSTTALRETTLLRMLSSSPYVVKMLKTVHEPPTLPGYPPITHMVFERMDCDLNNYISRHRQLPSEIVQRLMYHILLGLHHCHVIGVMHRDLKPHNILIDNSNPQRPIAKLADFGFGRTFTVPIQQMTEEITTLWYRPPEVLLGYDGHSPTVDIWSAACIFYELFENNTLFRGDCSIGQLIHIFQLLGTPRRTQWPMTESCQNWHKFPKFTRQNFRDIMTNIPCTAIDLLDKMLVCDPSKRPTAEECLKHRYFSSIFCERDLVMEPRMMYDVTALPLKPIPQSLPQQLQSHPTSGKSRQSSNGYHGSFF